jgi:hypothetical protein
VIRWLRSLAARLKAWAVSLMLQLDREQGAEEIARAIERAGFVGQPPRLVATERQAVIDQAKREQATADARIARQVGRA